MDTQVDGITWDQSDQSSARGTGIVCGALGFVTEFWNLSRSLGLFYWDWGAVGGMGIVCDALGFVTGFCTCYSPFESFPFFWNYYPTYIRL